MYIRNLRAYFKHMHSCGYITENPMETVENLLEDEKILRTLSGEQVRKLIGTINKGTPAGFRNYVYVVLLLDTGMRLEESLNFRMQDVFWDERRGLFKYSANHGGNGWYRLVI